MMATFSINGNRAKDDTRMIGMMFRMITRMIKNGTPTPRKERMRFQPDIQDDVGMVKTSKFKDTVNWDDDRMFSGMMDRMRPKQNTKKKHSINGQHPTLW